MIEVTFTRAWSYPTSSTSEICYPEGWRGAVSVDIADQAVAAGAAIVVGADTLGFAEDAPITSLLGLPTDKIVAELPRLSLADVQELAAAEAGGRKRKALLKELEAAASRKADEAGGDDDGDDGDDGAAAIADAPEA